MWDINVSSRYIGVCGTSRAYRGDWGLSGTILLCSNLQPSCHHHLGAQPKNITSTDRQVSAAESFQTSSYSCLHIFFICIICMGSLRAPLWSSSPFWPQCFFFVFLELQFCPTGSFRCKMYNWKMLDSTDVWQWTSVAFWRVERQHSQSTKVQRLL